MKFGIHLPIHGTYADPLTLRALAVKAEKAQWDGCFLWDHIHVRQGQPIVDPWIVLAQIAASTERIRLGPLVTPIFRRNPWKLARESVTLDHASKGRLILGVGLGSDAFGEINTFHGEQDDRVRAQMLDEGLTVLTGLWTGGSFAFSGKFYRIEETRFLPRPIQHPRIPIWMAATWPKKAPLRRAALYDGVVPVAGDFQNSLTPIQTAEIVQYVRSLSVPNEFDIVHLGTTAANEQATYRELSQYRLAGATWWIESFSPDQQLHLVSERIDRGPTKCE